MPDQSLNENINGLDTELSNLVQAVVEAVLRTSRTADVDNALFIRDELHRLPQYLMTEVLNGIIFNLVKIDPVVCRWFILDIFLRDTEPEKKADVAERINLLIADIQSLER